MKWILKRCLLAAPAIIFYSLFSFHACLLTGCSTDTTGHGGGGPRISGTSSPVLQLSAFNSTDSTGHGGGGVLYLQTSGTIPAGSSVVLDCTSPDCKLAGMASTDTTAPPGGVRRLILGTIPVDIPKNTNLELRIIPRGDPALAHSAIMVK
jgi:hypothetical protein